MKGMARALEPLSNTAVGGALFYYPKLGDAACFFRKCSSCGVSNPTDSDYCEHCDNNS